MTHLLRALCLAVALGACAGTNRASGTVAGHDFEAEVIDAKYCAHCSGGIEVTVVFRSPLGATQSGLLELRTEACPSENRSVKFGKEGARLSFSDDMRGGDSRDAIGGELKIDECSKDYLDAEFSAKFADGSSLKGSLSTKLVYDAGYD